jgi:adenylate kinase family enzyme
MRTRVHIFGASGAGTSALGHELARKCGFRFFDADDFFWEPTDPPYQIVREGVARQQLLRGALTSTDQWVLAGSICKWGDIVRDLFQLAVFVATTTEVRLERLRVRERLRFGSRIEPEGDMHKAFLEWAAQYDEGSIDMRSRRLHEEWMGLLPCPVTRVDGSLPLASLCDQVAAAMAA